MNRAKTNGRPNRGWRGAVGGLSLAALVLCAGANILGGPAPRPWGGAPGASGDTGSGANATPPGIRVIAPHESAVATWETVRYGSHGTSVPGTARTQNPLAKLTVTLSASPRKGAVPLVVAFTSTANGSATVTSYNFTWSFGDSSAIVYRTISVFPGQGATIPVSHNYTATGSFNASVTVSDNALDPTQTRTTTIVVTLKLVAVGSATPTVATVGRPVVLQVAISGGLAPYSVGWSATPSNCVVGTFRLTCQPPTAGNYSVRATSADSASNRVVSLINFTVNPKLTVVTTSRNWFHCFGPTGILTVNLTAVATGGTPPVSYSWNFGDGTPNATVPVTSHDFASAGSFNVTLNATDGSGAWSARSLTVTTTFPTCGVTPPPNYEPALGLVEGGAALVALVVGVLGYLYFRAGRPRPPPPAGGTSPVEIPWSHRADAEPEPPGPETPPPR